MKNIYKNEGSISEKRSPAGITGGVFLTYVVVATIGRGPIWWDQSWSVPSWAAGSAGRPSGHSVDLPYSQIS